MIPRVCLVIVFVFAGLSLAGGENIDNFDDQPFSEQNLPPEVAVSKLESSSTLKSDGKNSYSVKNLFDGDLSTCWAEGKKGWGIGEWIRISMHPGTTIYKISIANGYQKSKKLYYQNGAVKKIEIGVEYWNGESKSFKITLDNMGYTADSLQSEGDFHDVFPVIRIGDYADLDPMKKITLKILEVYTGTKYEDTCISEIFLYGDQEGYGDAYGD
jgi:hypothetical protein